MSAEPSADLGVVEASWLGLLQSLTEFLPVSSSAHLALAQYFLGLNDLPTFFDVMLHVGTLVAVLFYFRGLFCEVLWPKVAQPADSPFVVLPSGLAPPAASGSLPSLTRLIALLVLGTLPVVAAVGVFPKSKPDRPHTWRNDIGNMREEASNRPWLVLGFLACTSVILVVASRARPGQVGGATMSWWHAVVIGIAQSFSALCPGLSRSGMTISTSLALGFRSDWAVQYSLLLSIPAILGAVVLHGAHLDPAWITTPHLLATGIGTVISAVVGFFCIGWLARAVQRGRWAWFAPYLWLLILAAGVVLETQR
jgi:undecaprenyl-diphosphatase